jgi:iron complex outermembrane receptor protein
LGGRISFTPAVSLRSDAYMFEIPTPALDPDGYFLVDASAAWTSPDDVFKLSVNLRNLTNERYRVGGYNFPGALFGNSIIGYYGPPRTATFNIEYRF